MRAEITTIWQGKHETVVNWVGYRGRHRFQWWHKFASWFPEGVLTWQSLCRAVGGSFQHRYGRTRGDEVREE